MKEKNKDEKEAKGKKRRGGIEKRENILVWRK